MSAEVIGLRISANCGSDANYTLANKRWTTAQLYQTVATKMHTHADRFYLTTRGSVIQNSPDRRISDYDLFHNDTLVFTIPLQNLIQHQPQVIESQRNRADDNESDDEDQEDSEQEVESAADIEWTDEPCCMSYDDDPSEKRAKMPHCGCVFAPESLKDYVEKQMKEGFAEFDCPGYGCHTKFDFFTIYPVLEKVMTEEELKATARQVDDNFLKSPEQDIRRCETCKTYCRRDFSQRWHSNRNRVNCLMCSQREGHAVDFCWQCGQLWSGGRNGSCGNMACEKITKERLERLAACEMKLIARYKDECPSMRACPRCAVLVSHTKGCKHVKCVRCHLQFCFMCMKPQDADGEWQCGDPFHQCEVAPRQTSLPTGEGIPQSARPRSGHPRRNRTLHLEDR